MIQSVIEYNNQILEGSIPSSKWIYGQALRFRKNLERTDIQMNWESASAAIDFCNQLLLVGEYHGKSLRLQPWQEWVTAQIFGLQDLDGFRLTKLCILQCARGAGKTTFASALLLYEMCSGEGRKTYSIANNLNQAMLVLDTMKEMVEQMPEDNEYGIETRYEAITRPGLECTYQPLAALERSLDGLNPSFWVADEAAEFKGRYLSKLLTTGAKRRQITGMIVTTPGDNPENQYAELVASSQAILNGEVEDDSILPFLYGLDVADDAADESMWIKANPGLPIGQPHISSLKRQYATMKRNPMGRKEWERYHCAREVSSSSSWLDMTLWPKFKDPSITPDKLQGRPAWLGVDLSKSRDMSAICIAIPLDDGRIYVDGWFYWPTETARDRELDFRYPLRQWVDLGAMKLCAGKEVDYHMILAKLKELCSIYDVQSVGYDQWGSKFFSETAYNEGIPMQTYSMGIATLGPGCQILQQVWYNENIVFSDNPILKQCFGDVSVKTDDRNNLRPVKSRTYCSIDPVMATIIALHSSGAGESSIYNKEARAK